MSSDSHMREEVLPSDDADDSALMGVADAQMSKTLRAEDI